ncbi:MAG: accessory gene regulator B family protein [Anaerocolumna sp.]
MIHKLAIKLAALAVESDEDGLANEETYIYGFEIIISKILTCTILLCIGFLFNFFIEMLVFVTFMMFLRGQTGGFHMKTNYGCILCSIIISSLCVFIADNVNHQFALILISAILFLSSLYVIIYSPVNHPNLHLSKKEEQKCKIFSKKFLAIELFLISMVIAKIKKQEVLYNG